jgi:hypothetical protein
VSQTNLLRRQPVLTLFGTFNFPPTISDTTAISSLFEKMGKTSRNNNVAPERLCAEKFSVAYSVIYAIVPQGMPERLRCRHRQLG